MPSAKYILRVVHGIFTIFFAICITQIYYGFISNTRSTFLYIAIISVLIEFVVLLLNKGDCPLIYIQRKYGDEKYFFELFFPRSIAKKIIPIVAVITFIGLLLLLIQTSTP